MTPFQHRVLRIVRTVPSGRVTTYGVVATLAGSPRAARAVGQTLRTCVHDSDGVPWQRVINGQGRISCKGDTMRVTRQRDLLEAEGVVFDTDGRVDWDVVLWDHSDAPTFFDEPLPAGIVPRDFTG